MENATTLSATPIPMRETRPGAQSARQKSLRIGPSELFKAVRGYRARVRVTLMPLRNAAERNLPAAM
ncbi:protein of unknown function [Pararobbsia alpina]